MATRSLPDPVSVPPIIRSIALENDRVVVRVTGEHGQNYRQESCRILPEWTPRDAETSVAGGNYVFATDKADSSEFFRVVRRKTVQVPTGETTCIRGGDRVSRGCSYRGHNLSSVTLIMVGENGWSMGSWESREIVRYRDQPTDRHS